MKSWAKFARWAALLCALGLAACGDGPLVRQESYVFGTRVEVVSFGTLEPQAQQALAEVLREFDRLHRTYHAWQPSELSRLNEGLAAGQAVPVGAEMSALISAAQKYEALSGGLFDPAIGGLIRAWGFQSDHFEPRLPEPQLLADLRRAAPRCADVSIANGQAKSSNRAVQFDLGGIAKGYALDRAAAILRERGVKNALINIGGNVLALGSKGSVPWQVGVQSPRGAGAMASLPLYDGEAVGTSGDYQRFFDLNGRRYSHLIDPRTGEPAQGTQALTVLITPRADAGMLSDVASKPLFLSGAAWPQMAAKFALTHVLRVDAAGNVAISAPMRARLRWLGSEPRVKVIESGQHNLSVDGP